MILPQYLNPAAYLRAMKRLHWRLAGPAPLNPYPDYDEYWERRKADGRAPKLLSRYTKIAQLLPGKASVLDIGCGDGAFGSHLASVRPDCRYFGVDISRVSVSQARARGLDCAVLDPDKPLREQVDRDVNCVVLMEVLEHVHDAEALLQSALDLRPRVAYVTIPNVGCIVHRIRLAVFGRFPVTTIIYHMKEHIRFWTYRDFQQWVATFGLRIHGFYGQTGVGSRFGDYLALRAPKLFATQVIYELEPIVHQDERN